ncbi:MAG: PQQ-binding-like beta-propeller repeat protein [candidate division WOR-3 bacterium]
MKFYFDRRLLLILLASLAISAPIWPNWKYDRQLTGRCPYIGPEQPEIDWTFDTGDTFRIRNASPVIAEDGTIYFSSPDSFVFAINPDGTQKWCYKTQGVPYYPTLDDWGRIYVGVMGDSIWVLALDDSATYAKLVWSWSQINTENYWLPPLVIGPDRTVYITTDSLRAIDSTGLLKWSYNRGIYCGYPPAMSPDYSNLYYESADQYTVWLTSRDTNGILNWIRVIGPAPMALTWGSPAIGTDSTIYLVTGDGWLYGIRPNNTDKWPPLWNLGDLIFQSVSLGLNDTLWLMNRGYRPIYRKFSPDDGSITFEDTIITTPSQSNMYGSFIIDALGHAYIVVRDSGIVQSTLYAFNPDGTIKWSYALPGRIYRSYPAIGPNRYLYVVAGTTLYAIRDGYSVTEKVSGDKVNFDIHIYPNPFRNRLNIRFRILGQEAGNKKIVVSVYDALGRRVKSFNLESSNKDKISNVAWFGDDDLGHELPAGIYLLEFVVDGFKKTEKVVLLK